MDGGAIDDRSAVVLSNPRVVMFAAIATALVLGGAGRLAQVGAPSSHVALSVALAFLPYAGLVAWGDALPLRVARPLALGLALATGVMLVLAPPVLSDDLYRYLWDARVLGHGIDPYAFSPDDPRLAALRDPLYRHVAHAEIPTIYPPLAQLLFALADRVAHAPWSFKALALGAHLGTIAVVERLAPERHASRAVLAYALNPLALTETALSGHVDVFAGLAVAAAMLALGGSRPWRAAWLLAAASAVKLVGLVLAPLLALRDRRAAALALALSVAMLVPLSRSGYGSEDAVAGLGHYTRRWRGHEGAYALVEGAADLALRAAARVQGASHNHVRLTWIAPLVRLAAGTPLDPRAALSAPKKEVPDPLDFQIPYVAGLVARAVVAFGVLGLALGLVWARVAPLAAARLVLLVALLCAPQVHPWYLLSLLPLEAAHGRLAVLAWSASVLAAYAPLDLWEAQRVWLEPTWSRALAHAVPWSLLALELLRLRGLRNENADPSRGPRPRSP